MLESIFQTLWQGQYRTRCNVDKKSKPDFVCLVFFLKTTLCTSHSQSYSSDGGSITDVKYLNKLFCRHRCKREKISVCLVGLGHLYCCGWFSPCGCRLDHRKRHKGFIPNTIINTNTSTNTWSMFICSLYKWWDMSSFSSGQLHLCVWCELLW